MMPSTDNKGDYWHSRRPKYAVDEIFRIAQDCLLDRELARAYKLLAYIIGKGHEDADWLYDYLTNRLAELRQCAETFSAYDIEILFNTPDDRAFCYLMWLKSPHDYDKARIEELANKGYPIAQYMLGSLYDDRMLSEDDMRLARYWYGKAAEHNFSYAIFRLALCHGVRKPENIILILRAVNLNNFFALRQVTREVNNGKIWRETYSFNHSEIMSIYARNYIFGDRDQSNPTMNLISDILRDLKYFGHIDRIIPMAYVFGRELADASLYHLPLAESLSHVVDPVIAIYQQMSSKARRMAVQTILTLRRLGVVKDVAILIAKLVYQSRVESVWYVAVD